MIEFMKGLLGRWSETRSSVVEFADSHDFLAVLAAVILAALLGLMLLRLLRKLLRRIEWRIASWRGSKIRALRVQNQEILSEAQATQLAVRSARWAGYFLLAIVVYGYLQIVLSFFSPPRGLAARLFAILFVIFLLANYDVRATRLVFDGIAEGKMSFPGSTGAVANAVSGIVLTYMRGFGP